MSATNFFHKYSNPWFIETGSYMGDGIQQALDAGFLNIISIELSDKYKKICENRFLDKDNIKIIKGDSAHDLYNSIKDIDEPITFWLDGHHSCGDTALGEYWVPLIQELKQIKKHHINSHTIMIDDMRCWETFNPVHGFEKKDLLILLSEINNNYIFTYEDGICQSDVLVAHTLN